MNIVTVAIADKITVNSPFDPAMPSRARAIGGKWNAAEKAWQFDTRDEDRVRELLREIYGTDGSAETGPTVTVRVESDARSQEFRLAGRRLAWRPERDRAVMLGDGVVIVSGRYPARGGSVKNPRLDQSEAVILEVRDVPLEQAQKMCDQDSTAKIIDPVDTQRAALIAERDRLLARLAEIDAELGDA